MKNHAGAWAFACVTVSTFGGATLGCGAADQSTENRDGVSLTSASGESLGARFDAAAAPGAPKAVNWIEKYSADAADINHFNLSFATHICVLSGVTGDFEIASAPGIDAPPSGRTVALRTSGYQATFGSYWFDLGHALEIGPSDNAAQGWAICADWNNFLAQPGFFRFISGEATAFAGGLGSATATATMWGGDAITAIFGFQGRTDGFGEWSYVTQSTSTSSGSLLTTHEEDGSLWTTAGLRTYGRSIFVGIPNSGRLVRLIGYQGGAYGLSNANAPDTEFVVSTQSGYSSFWLAETNKALCYLTQITGRLRGFGEQVRIAQNGTRWLLGVTNGYGASAMGRARCMAYDQR